MNTIKWQFEGLEITFISNDQNLAKHILDMAKAHHLSLDHNIIIHYDDRTNQQTSAGPASGDGSTTANELAAVQMDTKSPKAGKKTLQLPNVPSNLGDATITGDTLEDDLRLSNYNGTGDRLAL
jgi:hypothetical protein